MYQLTRAHGRAWSAEMPIGDPMGAGKFQDPVTAGIAGGASLLGGALNSRASRRAADAQTRAAQDANAATERMFQQNRADMEPWRQGGMRGLNALMFGLGLGGSATGMVAPTRRAVESVDTFDADAYLRNNPDVARSGFASDPYRHYLQYGRSEGRAFPMTQEAQDQNAAFEAAGRQDPNSPWMRGNAITNGEGADSGGMGAGDLMRRFSLSDFEADPGAAFRLREGETAINRNALARGRFNSGQALRELQRFNSDLASQEFGSAYNRFNNDQTNRFNRLAALSGVGQTATQSVNSDRSAANAQIGSNILGIGNAQAAGRIGSANAWGNAINSGVNNLLFVNGMRTPRPQTGIPSMGGTWGGSV